MPLWVKVWITAFVLAFLMLAWLRAIEAYDNPLYVVGVVVVLGTILAMVGIGLIGIWQA